MARKWGIGSNIQSSEVLDDPTQTGTGWLGSNNVGRFPIVTESRGIGANSEVEFSSLAKNRIELFDFWPTPRLKASGIN